MALGLDEDHTVAGAQAVKRKAGRVLEHLDRGDIVRIDAQQCTTGSWRHFHAVDHVQGLHIGADGVVTANAYGEAAVGCARNQDPWYLGREGLFDRVATGAVEVFARNAPIAVRYVVEPEGAGFSGGGGTLLEAQAEVRPTKMAQDRMTRGVNDAI